MSEGAFYLFRTPESVDKLGPGMLRWLRECVVNDGPQFVKGGTYKDGRSLSQNDMHCGLCRDIAKQMSERTGLEYDTEYFRAKTKRKFGVICEQPDPETGKPEPYLMSTTLYSKAQFSKLIEGTLAYALVDLGVQLVDPRAAA